MKEYARALAMNRRRIDTTCRICGAAIVTRLKKDGSPERRYCSTRCRVKAYYREHREERLEYQRHRRRPAPDPAAGASGGRKD